ncbi:hemolysin family protein [Demequina lignilytica]|uniref:Hemolysin family protein n=1 Tax=Demequina lignilytica TaxID=3051663 RepID=A0AAW7M9Y5_9MICO|nr:MULTISPECIES: hemolysin family protein [unclassified Demequina]MDN4478305.1 hemolysin family protein [Demequina sp. SYSU T00039-1]MDN4482619.1 hemolysin family protein [Demequina sp. SYSU T0a273]MDN4489105.1 hemolysin family protein [Demequina sp. SYSU T00039]
MTAEMVAVVAGLLLANAFFVGAEFAIISARRSSIEPRAEEGSRAARTVLWAMEHVSLMLATAQLGITVCSVTLGAVAEPALAHALEPMLHSWGLPEGTAHGVAVAIALLVIVGLHVVVGEMVPKNSAVSSPDRAALVFGPPLVAIARVVKPVIGALNWVANHVVRLFGLEPKDEVTSAFTADEVHSIVERSSAEGTISDPTGLLTGALEFSDRSVAEVMVPVDRVRALELGVTVDGLERAATDTGFSRFPVTEAGRFIGYLHIKDTLFARPGEREDPIQAWRVRDLPAIDAEAEIELALALMRRSGAHVTAVERDGSTLGMVFLEDILEELVGEVRDSLARRDQVI